VVFLEISSEFFFVKMSESEFIADGIKLGYKDVELREYVKQRCERNERALERERVIEKEQYDLRKLEVEK